MAESVGSDPERGAEAESMRLDDEVLVLLSPAESVRFRNNDWTVIVFIVWCVARTLSVTEGPANTGTDFTSVAGTVCTSSSVSESVGDRYIRDAISGHV